MQFETADVLNSETNETSPKWAVIMYHTDDQWNETHQFEFITLSNCQTELLPRPLNSNFCCSTTVADFGFWQPQSISCDVAGAF